MKKIYFTLLAAAAVSMNAQTLTKATHDYIIGNTINGVNFNGTPDNSATGSSVTFNNNSLSTGSSITGQITAPTAADLLNFPGTTVKQDVGNGLKFLFKSSATMLEITGIVLGPANLNFVADNAHYLTFPTNFGDSNVDTARGTLTNGTDYGLFKGTATTNADATGTLLLSGQTYNNVIRVKTVQSYSIYANTDLTYSSPAGTYVSTFYIYYDTSNRYALFATGNYNVNVPFLGLSQILNTAVGQANPVLASQNTAVKNKLQVYPNPVNDYLFVAGDLSRYSDVQVISMDGKLVKSASVIDGKINVSKLQAGNYILQLSGSNKKTQCINIIKK